jgi:hypothetical protein
MANHFICTEGDTDRVVFEHLDPEAIVLPAKPKPCTSTSALPQGDAAAISTCIELTRNAPIRVTVALDMDNGTAEMAFRKVETAFRGAGLVFSGCAGRYLIDKTEVRVIAVGLPDDPILRRLGVAAHTVDDYLILMLADDKVRAGLLEKRFIGTSSQPEFLRILESTLKNLREWGIPIAGSKQLLDVSRAILGFRASPATMAQAILSVAPPGLSQGLLAPLVQALH